ncbi:hypothetical protein BC834DRAFT_881451 [Gloeopeniophorella convolvens]|nr:hypothetical protein BC834DRAFT_881451 [Gloeopeniophorella convolvens]
MVTTGSYPCNNCVQLRHSMPDRVTSCSDKALPRGVVLQRFEDGVKTVTNNALPALNVHSSAAAPISRLPNEILLLIFHECQRGTVDDLRRRLGMASGHLYYPDRPSKLLPKFNLARTACSQVCNRWRNVILGAAFLWKDILVDFGPKAFETLHYLSKSFPGTHCYGNLHESMWKSSWREEIFPVDFSRMSVLFLRARRYRTLMSFLDDFRLDTPLLELIDLGANPVYSRLSKTSSPVPAICPLIQNSSKLRRIKLAHVPVAWEKLPRPLCHLTQLEVVHFGGDLKPTARADDILEFLRSTPALEILKLESCFLEDDYESGSSRQVVKLPHLRWLVLDAAKRDFLCLFHRVDFPTSSRVRATCNYEVIDEESAISIINRAFRYFHETPVGPESNGIFGWKHADVGRGLHVVAHSTTDELLMTTLFCRDDDEIRDVDLIFHGRSDEDHEDNIHRAACDALPTSFARTLSIVGCRNTQVWRAHALHFPRLLTIHSDFWCSSTALSHVISPFGPSAELSLLFPELTWLIMSPASTIKLQFLEREFLPALRARKMLGRPLKRFSLRSSHDAFGEGTVAALQDVVTECVEIVDR